MMHPNVTRRNAFPLFLALVVLGAGVPAALAADAFTFTFRLYDKDGDGFLKHGEFMGQANRDFQKMDTNGDTQLTLADFPADPGEGEEGEAQAAPPTLESFLPQPLQAAAADGAVTKQEYHAYIKEMFDRTDADHDNKISMDELRSYDQNWQMEVKAKKQQGGKGKK